jgi:hypothetical protein
MWIISIRSLNIHTVTAVLAGGRIMPSLKNKNKQKKEEARRESWQIERLLFCLLFFAFFPLIFLLFLS